MTCDLSGMDREPFADGLAVVVACQEVLQGHHAAFELRLVGMADTVEDKDMGKCKGISVVQ